MRGAFTTCTETTGSGARIGTGPTTTGNLRQTIPLVRFPARPACFVAVAGYYHPANGRSALRFCRAPGDGYSYLGFRVTCKIPTDPGGAGEVRRGDQGGEGGGGR